MAEPSAVPDPRAQTMAAQGLANRVVRGLLRTPLLSRAVGSRLVTLYVTGRKSRRRYTVPVAYTRQGDDLLIGTPFGWGRNLRTGEPAQQWRAQQPLHDPVHQVLRLEGLRSRGRRRHRAARQWLIGHLPLLSLLPRSRPDRLWV